MTTACGPVGGAPRRLAVTGRMRAGVAAAGAAFCAATELKTRPAPRTRAAVRPSPIVCLTAMLLSPRCVVAYFRLLQGLRLGVRASRPFGEQGSKTADDVRPLRRPVVALADVVAQVVQQQVVRVHHELPVALAHGLLRAVGVGRRPPEQRPLLFWRTPLEYRKDVDPFVARRNLHPRRGEDRCAPVERDGGLIRDAAGANAAGPLDDRR